MGQIIGLMIQNFMMQRQKYSKTAVYIAVVAGAAFMASQGVDVQLAIGGQHGG